MPKVSTYSCRICGRLREGNHWYLLSAETQALTIRTIVAKWSDMNLDETTDVVCGEGCAQKALGNWLATRTLDPPSAQKIKARSA